MSKRQFDRRSILLACAGTALGALASAQAGGKTTRIVVGFPPGQATDNVARLVADRLRPVTGETYIVDNKPGQGGSLALGELAKAAPDGSTMMLAHMSALCTNPHMYKRVPYDSLKDFEPIGLVGDLPFVLVCNPGMPFTTVQELIQHAKAHPGELSNASSGNGTVSHLAMEEFKRRAGVIMVHIPYKGSMPGLTDVVAGNVSLALETAAAVKPFVQNGRLRALAAGTSKRLGGELAVPTLSEQGMGDFNTVTWLMLLYPAGTPQSLTQATFGAMSTALRTPEVEQRLVALNCQPRYSTSPDEAMAYLRSQYKTWGEIVKRSGTTLD